MENTKYGIINCIIPFFNISTKDRPLILKNTPPIIKNTAMWNEPIILEKPEYLDVVCNNTINIIAIAFA